MAKAQHGGDVTPRINAPRVATQSPVMTGPRSPVMRPGTFAMGTRVSPTTDAYRSTGNGIGSGKMAKRVYGEFGGSHVAKRGKK